MKHPQYKEVVRERSDDYYAVSRLKEVRKPASSPLGSSDAFCRPDMNPHLQLVTGARASQDQIVAWLEQREASHAGAGPEPSGSVAIPLCLDPLGTATQGYCRAVIDARTLQASRGRLDLQANTSKDSLVPLDLSRRPHG